MKIFISFSLFILSTIVSFKSIAQNAEFIENKGQWDSHVKYAAQMNAGGIFLQPTGFKILLNNEKDEQRIHEYFHGMNAANTAGKAVSDTSKLILHSHAYQVTFQNASEKTEIVPEKVLTTYNNYFTGKDPSKWASHCKIFSAVTYKNIYPNIDARYYTDKGQLKYDLIVNPGGDVSKIALQYDGVDGLSLKKGNLIVKNSINDVTELAPESYQLNETGKKNIPVDYVISGNVVRFRLRDNYEKNKTLVIDPTEVFCSFTGSQADNWGYTATFDGQGNFYAGGIAFGNGFIYPMYVGPYQTTFAGGDGAEGAGGPIDVAIMKLSSDGKQRLFATYLGGEGDEQSHSMIVDHDGNLIIAGRTHSANFPEVPSAANQFGPTGGFDIFISKLSSDGSALLGSIKIGGTGTDGVNIQPKEADGGGTATSITRNYGDDARSEVMVDAQDNIYLGSCTQSTDFLTTANAFSRTLSGRQDGVVIKIASSLLASQMIFCSFLGGSGDDASFVIDLSPVTNNIYVGGSTTSTNFPGVGGNVLGKVFNGGVCDGYVTEITNGGSYNIINSTYIGTGADDMLYGLKFDKTGNPYVMGTTTGSWPIVNAAWSVSGGKQFIAKLYPDLHAYQYSTVFGSTPPAPYPNISPIAFLVDRCENVYVSGWGGNFDRQGYPDGKGYPNSGTANLPITAGNGLLPSTDNNDFYFFVLEKDAKSQLYGGWFGQIGGFDDHVDGGTSRYDQNGVIYQGICANCVNSEFNPPATFPTTQGVWSRTNGALSGAQCNMAAVKIAFELAGVGSGVQASINGIARDTFGCVPLTVNFTDTVDQAVTYVWDFGDGTKRDTTRQPNNTDAHTYTSIGNYQVMLISIDSSKCNIADTSYTNIKVGNIKAPVSFIDKKLPPCTSLTYQFINTSTAPAGYPFSATSFSWDFGDGTLVNPGPDTVIHSFAASGTYIVKLNLNDTTYCNSPDAAIDTLRIAANVKAQFTTPPYGCAPYDALFTNTSLAGQHFYWDFGDGTTDSSDSPTHLYELPGTYIVKLVAVDTSTCNKIDSISFTIIVSPKPTAGFIFSPVPPIANTPIVFVNTSSGGTRYLWNFGDGDTLVTVQYDTLVNHVYNKTGSFNACQVVYNQYGCTDTICQMVQSLTTPLLDVPNAFSPNGDGMNDQIHVKGYGFDQFDWRIYNRWGVLVFHSASSEIGWDGRYKGVLQPEEVYTYILNVQFTDGTIYRKTGDITLLR